jgi:hypothetical protein
VRVLLNCLTSSTSYCADRELRTKGGLKAFTRDYLYLIVVVVDITIIIIVSINVLKLDLSTRFVGLRVPLRAKRCSRYH